ncbi:MAG: LysR substrate-binding domain-containing protein [Pseudoxanthomonas sp.]
MTAAPGGTGLEDPPAVVDKLSEERAAVAYNPPSRKTIPPFEALRAFDAVARLGSVRNAARSLWRDHAVISRHLKALETWTGATLIERTARGAVLTDEGRRYHKEIAAAMDAIASSTIELMRRGCHNHLNIACAPGFALHWMSRHVGVFERSHPGVEIELRPSDRGQDKGLFEPDIEIRFVPSYRKPLEWPAAGSRCEVAATMPILAVASSDYLAASARIKSPRDLLGHRLLHEIDFDGWANWLAEHDVYEELDLTGPRLWHGHLTLDAAIHGRGVALMNFLLAEKFIGSGQLVDIGEDNPDFQPPVQGNYLVISPVERWDMPLVSRYRDWLLESLRKDFPGLTGGC